MSRKIESKNAVSRRIVEPGGLCDRSIPKGCTARFTPVLSHKSRRRDPRWTGKQIAKDAGVSPATVSGVLRRYERAHPGERIQVDIGRFNEIGHRIPGDRTGQSNRAVAEVFVHVCIDDSSRRAFAEIMPNKKHANALNKPGLASRRATDRMD